MSKIPKKMQQIKYALKSLFALKNNLIWFYSLTTFVDRIIIILALTLVLQLYWYYWRIPTTEASHAIILVKNHQSQSISLHQSQIIEIQGQLGISTLQVKTGKIRFLTSPCQQKQCIHAGWLKNQGNFIACLPNQVSIQLAQKTQPWDAIAY